MKKVLFVVPHYACNPTSGGGQRTQLLFSALKKLEFVQDIDVVVTDERGRSAAQYFDGAKLVKTVQIKSRAEVGVWRALKKIVGGRADGLATAFGRRKVQYSDKMLTSADRVNWRQYDIIVGRYMRPTAMLGCFESNLPLFLDIDDRDDVLYSSRLNSPDVGFVQRVLISWHLKQMRAIQRALLPRCRHGWLASVSDLNTLPLTKQSVLPNIPFNSEVKEEASPLVENNQSLLFVGSYGHRINRDGLLWFVNECWDEIKNACPGATLRVVGSGGWEALASQYKHKSGVEFVGFCESLDAEYVRCTFTVVPLFEGGGTKIKVLESYLHSRAVCGSTHAYFGYEDLSAACSAMIVPSSQQFVDCVVKNLHAPVSELAAVANAGKKIVRAQFSTEAFDRSVYDAFTGSEGK